ncbi:MAG TPA: hypothetical protein VG621_00425 [Candidatus Paceibacterota bacterium]|nr:hypothetical protein [Candidatus Paceibacterota bacterium]
MKKKQFSLDEIGRIRKIWLDLCAITGGPNNEQLKKALFEGEEIYFWLDDTVKAIAEIDAVKYIPNGAGLKIVWEISGRIKPQASEIYLYSFDMQYNSYLRQGNLENGTGFTKLEFLS